MSEDFPKTLQLAGKEFILCGAGTRKITFLKFSVYRIGIYVEKAGLEQLKRNVKKISLTDEVSLCSAIHETPVDIAIQICPIRNTDGIHMRNGISKFLKKDLPPKASEDENSIRDLGMLIPKDAIMAGSRITFLKNRQGSISLFMGQENLGKVSNSWLAKAFISNYTCKSKPISQDAKSSFIEELIK